MIELYKPFFYKNKKYECYTREKNLFMHIFDKEPYGVELDYLSSLASLTPTQELRVEELLKVREDDCIQASVYLSHQVGKFFLFPFSANNPYTLACERKDDFYSMPFFKTLDEALIYYFENGEQFFIFSPSSPHYHTGYWCVHYIVTGKQIGRAHV